MIAEWTWYLHAGCTMGQPIFLSTVTSRIVLVSNQLHLLCIPRGILMYKMWGSHSSEDGHHLSARLRVITSWKTIILMTLSTAVPWVKGDRTTDWVDRRASVNIEREKSLAVKEMNLSLPASTLSLLWLSYPSSLFVNFVHLSRRVVSILSSPILLCTFIWPEVECYQVNKSAFFVQQNHSNKCNLSYRYFVWHHNTLKPEIHDHEI